MRRAQSFLLLLFISNTIFAQTRLGVFTGLSSYQGDLVDAPFQSSRGAIGFTANFPVSERLSIRTGLTFAKVAGADSLNTKAAFRLRNLNFQSPVTELSLLGEYNLFNLDQVRWSPYAFAGVAVFRYNPFTFSATGAKVYLQPLSTEGQGIAGYAQKPYSLTGFAIPFGGGVKFMLSDNVNLGLEAGLRVLFTDHLDDVSTAYADATDLLNARGQLAVDLAFRADETRNSTQIYPAKAEPRGSAKSKDYYYFTGLHLTFGIGDGLFRGGGGKRGYGCPANVM